MNINFSIAQTSDKNQLLQLLSDRQDESNRLRGGTSNVVRERGNEYFDKVISDENILLILGKDDDRVISTATIFFLPRIRKASYFAIIEDVLVSKEYLGQGIDTLLMKFAIDLCKRNPKIRKIKLGSLLKSKKAHQFYEQLGFKAEEIFFH